MFAHPVRADQIAALLRHCRAEGRPVLPDGGEGFLLGDLSVSLKPPSPGPVGRGMWAAHGPDEQYEPFCILLGDATDSLDDEYTP